MTCAAAFHLGMEHKDTPADGHNCIASDENSHSAAELHVLEPKVKRTRSLQNFERKLALPLQSRLSIASFREVRGTFVECDQAWSRQIESGVHVLEQHSSTVLVLQ
jgi:hypothetical protein